MIQNKAIQKLNQWRAPVFSDTFDMFKSYKKIGSCSVARIEKQNPPNEDKTIFPKTWFYSGRSNEMRMILEITGLESFHQRGCGNGRACLQALYEFSRRVGCGGRMQVVADFNSGAFYEHCGFKGMDAAQDGFKYFDPTAQNLKLLFPKGMPNMDYRFIPVETLVYRKKQLSETDKILFNRMLQKSKA